MPRVTPPWSASTDIGGTLAMLEAPETLLPAWACCSLFFLTFLIASDAVRPEVA